MVEYRQRLTTGILIRRYQRFLADVRLDTGEDVTAHVPNTGRMTGHSAPGLRVLLSRADNPRRKLGWTLEQVHDGRCWVGVNTAMANRIVREAVETGVITELGGYGSIRQERPYGERSRIDLLLEAHPDRPGQPCWVEVKNTTLGDGDWALYPDAVTARGARHMLELKARVEAGDRAVVLFSVQREDSRRFRPADHVDPIYGRALREAVAAGVEAYAYRAELTAERVRLVAPLPDRRVRVTLEPGRA